MVNLGVLEIKNHNKFEKLIKKQLKTSNSQGTFQGKKSILELKNYKKIEKIDKKLFILKGNL